MLPPSRGYRPHTTSRFASTNRPPGSTNPHRGLDANYYLGPKANPQSGLNLDHPTIRSPVAGDIVEIEPSLGRIVIRETDAAGNYTGYQVEILHTNTRSVEKGPVYAGQPIATMGGVGVNGKGRPDGFQHMHVQVIDPAGNVVNPLRHLFEYHHPGEPIPSLPQFEPQQLGPRAHLGAALQAGDQRQPAPSGAPKSNDAPAGAMSTQLPPGTPIGGAEGPTVIGGPGPLRPLVPPAPSRSSAPASPATPAVDPTLPPLHFAPEKPQRVGPFEVPGLFLSDAFGRARVAPAADRTPTNPSVLPTPSSGAPSTSAPATSPAASGSAGQISAGIGEWWKAVAPAASSNFDPSSLRGLTSPMLGGVPTAPTQPVFDSGLPGMLARAGAFDPPAGGLLGLLLEHMRNNPDHDVSA